MKELRALLQTSFQELETTLFQILCAQFRSVLQEVLAELDERLYQARDRGRWRVKGFRERDVEGLLGPVRLRRRQYWDEAEGRYVFLLDEALGLTKRARVSPGLVEAAVWQGLNGPSYRQGQAALERLYGRPVLSHETIRQLVLQTGTWVTRETQRRQEAVQGTRRVPMLFLEADGLYVHLQRDQAQGLEKQVVVSHEGWERRSGQDYALKERHYYVASEGEDFWESVSRQIYSRYDLAGAVVVLNGDRAPWIREGVEYFRDAAVVLYQWDRFHLAKELRQLLVHQPERLQAALEAFRQSDATRLLAELAQAEGAERDAKRRARIRGLKQAVLADPEAVRDYRVRLRERGYSTQGLRGLGAAESTMDRFANRMKKRGQSWGRHGLHPLVAALAKHLEGQLQPYVQHLALVKELSGLVRWVEERTAGLTRRIVQDVYVPKQGSLPATRVGRQRASGLNHFLNQIRRPSLEWV